MSSTTEMIAPENQKILFLDIEGVMTRGMYGVFSALMFSHLASAAFYPESARRAVQTLCEKHGFKIVLITRHGRLDSAALKHRLLEADIDESWLYAPDPEAIPEYSEHKGDSIMGWFTRNPDVPVKNTVAADDNPDSLTRRRYGGEGYPADRIVAINSATGMTYRDYLSILKKVGVDLIQTVKSATASPGSPKLQGQ